MITSESETYVNVVVRAKNLPGEMNHFICMVRRPLFPPFFRRGIGGWMTSIPIHNHTSASGVCQPSDGEGVWTQTSG